MLLVVVFDCSTYGKQLVTRLVSDKMRLRCTTQHVALQRHGEAFSYPARAHSSSGHPLLAAACGCLSGVRQQNSLDAASHTVCKIVLVCHQALKRCCWQMLTSCAAAGIVVCCRPHTWAVAVSARALKYIKPDVNKPNHSCGQRFLVASCCSLCGSARYSLQYAVRYHQQP
jgi:hypothetical protein